MTTKEEPFFYTDLQSFSDTALPVYVCATIVNRIRNGWKSMQIRAALQEYADEVIRRYELNKEQQ